MTTISLRMDDQMKKELDEMCEAMGMNISTFYMIYTKKALKIVEYHLTLKLRQIHFILNRIWHSFANLLNK